MVSYAESMRFELMQHFKGVDGLAIRCITTLPTLQILRRGQDSNLQPHRGDGFQNRLTAAVHPSLFLIN